MHKEKPMNIRPLNARPLNARAMLSAALAAAALLALAPAQAQAPAPADTQKMEAKIALLQAQVNALQSQVKQLQTQLRVASPAPVMVYPPSLTLPGLNKPGNPQMFLAPPPRSRNGSIPDYTATFVAQPAR